MKYDVIIIGAGPGGIFSAYELLEQNKDLKIAVFEAGAPLEKRRCPIDGDKVKTCIKCKTCAIMSGFGGAGAFSDGKYNITNDFGGTLYEHIGKKKSLELMHYVDDLNVKFGGGETKMYSTAGTKFKKLCLQNKLNLLDASVRHLGTDINYIVLDCVASKYGCRMQGTTDVAFTVLDVLGYLDEIPVCVAYDIDGEITTEFPTTALLEKAKPVIETLPGWKCDIRGIKNYEDLPENCRKYIEFVEEKIGFPITMVSNGPSRDDIIYRNK